jgi:hypothetical protein
MGIERRRAQTHAARAAARESRILARILKQESEAILLLEVMGYGVTAPSSTKQIDRRMAVLGAIRDGSVDPIATLAEQGRDAWNAKLAQHRRRRSMG